MGDYDKILREENLEVINTAIRKERVNHKNKYGETPLMFAAAEGYSDKVRTLIDMGAEVRAESCSLDSVIMYLTKVENKSINREILGILLDNGARINCRNKAGDTLLIKAIKENNINMLENLIDLNIDVELTGYELITPLMVAAKEGRNKILKLLINSGAAINKRDTSFNTALIYAIAYNQQKAADILMNEGSKVEAYFIFNILKLIDKNSLDSKNLIKYLYYLISKGAEINYHGDYGKERETYTPLMIALRGNMDYELIKALIIAGAQVNPVVTWYMGGVEVRSVTMYATDHPLRLAIYYTNNNDIIKLLIEEGAKVNMSKKCLDYMGELRLKYAERYKEYITPLKLAVEHNRDQIADYLIEQGARYNIVDKDIWAYKEEDYLSISRDEDEGKSLKEDYDLEEFFEAFADKSSEE